MKKRHISDLNKHGYLEEELIPLMDTVMDNVSVGIALFDKAYRYKVVNKKMSQLNGIAIKDHLGKTVNEVLPSIAPELKGYIRRVYQTGQPIYGIKQISSVKGHPGLKSYWTVDYLPVKNNKKTIVGVAAFTQNITKLHETTEKILLVNRELEKNNQEIKISEERFKAILEQAPFMVIVYRESGEIIHVNQEWTKITGYKIEDIPTTSRWMELAYREKASVIVQLVYKLSREKEPYRGSFEIYTKSGEKKDIEFSSSTIGIFNEAEKLRIVTGLDITERKKWENVLEENKENLEEVNQQLQGLFNNAPAGLALFDVKPPYKVLAHNYVYQSYWPEPFRSQGMLGRYTTDYVPPVEGKEIFKIFRKVARTKKGETLINFEFNGMPWGKTWWNWNLSPVVVQGKLVAFAHMLIEVTREVKARELLEQELRLRQSIENEVIKANNLLETILNSTHMQIVYLDKNFNFIKVNQAYAKACKKEMNEFIGKNHFDLYPNEENERIFGKAVLTGKPYFVFAKPFIFPDQPEKGVTYWDWSLIPTKDTKGSVEGLVFTLTDVTPRVKAEEFVLDSEKRLRMVLDNLPIGVRFRNVDGEVVYENPEGKKIWSGTDNSLRQYPKEWKVWHADTGKSLKSQDWAVNRAIKSKKPILNEEIEIETAGKTHKVIKNSVIPILDRKNDITGTVIMYQDITHDVAVKEALQSSEERFSKAFNASPDSILITRVADGSILEVNDTFETMFGYTRKEAIGRSTVNLGLFSSVVERRRYLSQVKGKVSSWTQELRMKTKSGEQKIVILSVESITVNSEMCYLKIIRDITDRVIIREALRKERELLEAIIDRVPVMINIYEKVGDKKIVRANEEFKKKTKWIVPGMDQDELLQKCYPDPEKRKQVLEYINLSQPLWKDMIITTKDGREIETSWSNISLGDKTQVGIGIDITDRKKIENSLREQDRKKDEFISIASHELKTPLTAVKTYLQFHKRKLEKENDKENLYFVSKVNDQVDRIQHLVEDLLDVSRIQLGRLTYKKEKLDLDDLLNKVIVDIQLSQDNYTITKKGSVKSNVLADPARISQVFYNLLNNAMKYSPDSNKIQVIIKEKNGRVIVGVRDFGIGIPKNEQQRIFDRFYRIEKKNGASGFGIGLFIVQEIVKSHSGKIWVESVPGKGSTFYVSLPIYKRSIHETPGNAIMGKVSTRS